MDVDKNLFPSLPFFEFWTDFVSQYRLYFLESSTIKSQNKFSSQNEQHWKYKLQGIQTFVKAQNWRHLAEFINKFNGGNQVNCS